jgi:hypothetical protein
MWQVVTPWVGFHILYAPDAYSNPSFTEVDSDSMWQWIQTACFGVLALAGALVWVWIDVKRTWDARIHELLRVYVRYALAAAMLGYGMIKVLLLQMGGGIGASSLSTPLGEFTPNSLLWTFIAYSPAYQVFTGLAEVVGGALLLFRRTTTLGALVTAGVMSNVVMLDLNYDVPVKINSIHFLLVAMFLIAPELRRLVNVLVLNRATEPAPNVRLCARGRVAKAVNVLKAIFVLGMLYVIGSKMNKLMQLTGRLGAEAAVHEMAGFYKVESFVQDGQVVQSVSTDRTSWWGVDMEANGGVSVWGTDYSPRFWWPREIVAWEPTDPTHGLLRIAPDSSDDGSRAEPILLTYARPTG